MMAAVIVVLGFFAVMSAALMGMTITVLRVTEAHDRSAQDVRAVDGALEIVANRLRLDTDAAGSGCVGASTNEGFASSYAVSTTSPDGSVRTVVVECDAEVTASRRILTLDARTGSDWKVKGSARVRIDDTADGTSRPGASLIVCDWQLGAARTGSLAECPA
jgi:hypothetical protein